jgi:hypothetical protein
MRKTEEEKLIEVGVRVNTLVENAFIYEVTR